MLNPSVEPTARRESTRERRDSEGKARRASASANSRENKRQSSVGGRDSVDAGISGSVLAEKGADSTASAAEARNQRRSIGLQVRNYIAGLSMYVIAKNGKSSLDYSTGWPSCLICTSMYCCTATYVQQSAQHVVEYTTVDYMLSMPGLDYRLYLYCTNQCIRVSLSLSVCLSVCLLSVRTRIYGESKWDNRYVE